MSDEGPIDFEKELKRLRANSRESAMRELAHGVEWEQWAAERAQLRAEVSRLEAETVDLKNQLADLRWELSMRSWLS